MKLKIDNMSKEEKIKLKEDFKNNSTGKELTKRRFRVNLCAIFLLVYSLINIGLGVIKDVDISYIYWGILVGISVVFLVLNFFMYRVNLNNYAIKKDSK